MRKREQTGCRSMDPAIVSDETCCRTFPRTPSIRTHRDGSKSTDCRGWPEIRSGGHLRPRKIWTYGI